MKSKKGFTLVELVIVVLILGILAAVAVPKLFNQSSTAMDNGLKQTLGVVRDAIELYAAENGKLPGAPGVDGDGNPTTGDLALDLETYLRGPFPKCPVGSATDASAVKMSDQSADITGEASPAKGWHYNSQTGQFIVNFNGASATDPTVNYDAF